MGENGRNDGSSKYNDSTDAATSQPQQQQQTFTEVPSPAPPSTTPTQQSSSTPLQTTATTTNRFADYFVICGLDLDTGLEPDRFAGMYTLFSTYFHHFSFHLL